MKSAIPRESEKAFQAQVIRLAGLYGWMVYHTHDSRRSNPGFPDLILVRPPRLLAIELKAHGGRVSAEQRRWLDAFRACSEVQAFTWWASTTGIWDHIAEVLTR